MENASKALLIAGSILLALMILSLIVYVSTSTSRMVQAQEEKKATEEIAAFNRQYEAYNKKKMYGTDIITVTNKAIEYNKKEAEKIEIELVVHSTYETVIETLTTNGNGKVTSAKERKPSELRIEPEETYSNEKLKTFFNQPVNDILGVKKSDTVITNTYSALTVFKNSTFKCTGVTYSSSGKINKMSFEEITNFSDK